MKPKTINYICIYINKFVFANTFHRVSCIQNYYFMLIRIGLCNYRHGRKCNYVNSIAFHGPTRMRQLFVYSNDWKLDRLELSQLRQQYSEYTNKRCVKSRVFYYRNLHREHTSVNNKLQLIAPLTRFRTFGFMRVRGN